MVEERGLIDPERLREQPWKTGRDPRLQGARLQEDYPRCCHLCFCCTTTGHHADLISCPRCSSFISGCTGMGGRVHCQVLGALLHVPGCGGSKSQTLWLLQWKTCSYIPISHSVKNSPRCKDRWILTGKGMYNALPDFLL